MPVKHAHSTRENEFNNCRITLPTGNTMFYCAFTRQYTMRENNKTKQYVNL